MIGASADAVARNGNSSFLRQGDKLVRRPDNSRCNTQPSDPSSRMRPDIEFAVISTGRPRAGISRSCDGPLRGLREGSRSDLRLTNRGTGSRSRCRSAAPRCAPPLPRKRTATPPWRAARAEPKAKGWPSRLRLPSPTPNSALGVLVFGPPSAGKRRTTAALLRLVVQTSLRSGELWRRQAVVDRASRSAEVGTGLECRKKPLVVVTRKLPKWSRPACASCSMFV